MGKIEKFEDITAWQLARELVQEVYKVTSLRGFREDFGLRDQIRRGEEFRHMLQVLCFTVSPFCN
jgi:hypothetical protein